MDYLHTILMGFMQGLTEFLPVSSSGHIVLTSAIYKIVTGAEFAVAENEEVFFDVMIHFGTLLAVLLYFKNELVDIFKSFFNSIKTRNFDNYEAMLPVYIFVGTFFTCCIVLLLSDLCADLITKPNMIGITLMITGLILLTSEFLSKKYSQKLLEVNMKKSILIGIAQGIAVIPGISRSGTTIATAIACGISRDRAAKYSFLLSIPVILLAVLYEIPEVIKPEVYTTIAWGPVLVGTLIAAVTGYFCVKYFIAFLKRFSLNVFAYYCLALGAVAFGYFQFFA